MDKIRPERTVLLVDDDERLTSLTGEYLRQNGYRVAIEHDGARSASRIIEERPAVVILDIMLPGDDGIAICKKVRPHYPGLLLILTARSGAADQVMALEAGADDYVVKPVAPRVLLAHLTALLRGAGRAERAAIPREAKHLMIDNLTLDAVDRQVWFDDKPADLSSVEFDLLWLLATNAGHILSREAIFTRLYGYEYDGQDRSVDICVSRIRAKIGDDAGHPYRIKTVRGKGYVLIGEPVIERPGQRPGKALVG